MKTHIIKIKPGNPDPKKIKYAARALEKGKLVVFPTETVYGIGANAKNKKTISRLRRLKARPGAPFSFHIASSEDLEKLKCVVNKQAASLIKKFWPGPLTLVLSTKTRENIGVRMPAHPVAFMLLKETRVPVVAPSANFKNELPAVTANQAFEDLKGLVDIIIDSGRTNIGISSTVLDLTKKPAKILREGTVTKKAIEKVIGKINTKS